MTGSPTSTGSPSKRRRKSGSASPTPWCTSFTWCRTLRCSGSSTRSTGTGRRSTATRPSRICSASWPSADRACSRPTSSSCGLSTPRSPRCPTRRRPLRRRQLCRRRPPGRSCRPARCHGRSRRRPARPSAPEGFRGPPGRREPSGSSPLPPVRPQRPDPQRPDPQRPDPQRPDPQRPDSQRPDQQRPRRPTAAPRPAARPDSQRLEQQRPDQRQVPSAGRHYRG